MQRAQFIEVVRVTEIRRLLVEFPQYRKIHEIFTDSDSRDRALAIHLEFLCSGVSAICQLAATRRAHVLADSKLEEEVIRSFLQRPTVDDRHLDLKKLATLNVPAIAGDVSSLVNLRRSNDDFAEWRNHLSGALTHIGELSDEESIEEAAGIVYAELSEGLSQVNTAVRQSPALQAAKAGLTQLVISGISGTTAEVMTNNPWVGLAAGATGAAAGTVLDAGLNLAKALQARRKGRLILDVAMLFDPQRSVDN